MILTFDPASTRGRAEIVADVRERVAREFPGVATAVEQPIAHLLSHILSGVNAQVAIKVHGPDVPTLRGLATEVEDAVRGVDGVEDLRVETQVLHLVREEGRPFGVATIVRAGQERAIPVRMTALCTGIALVPIALTPTRRAASGSTRWRR